MKKILFPIIILSLSILFAEDQGAKYLIITHDNFYSSIQPLAEWKHKKGMRTKIARLSEIGSTPMAIRNYIFNAYYYWPVKPQFILLVGAPGYLPFPIISDVYTDNYYTDVDGDVYNEILSGRLTVHNTTEAQTVVSKILMYERTPNLVDSLWFKKACLIANDYAQGFPDEDSLIYRLDAEYAANYMVNSGYVRVDTFFATHGDNVTSVVNAANNGRGFVLYRGRGTNNWYSPFAVNPDGTSNGAKLPIVLSITCSTIGTGTTPATAEKWFLTGTPTTLRGASGYFATSTHGTNIAYLRSAVTRGFFDGVFLYGYPTFGEACEGGRLKVYADYPYSGGLKEYYGFTTVGDPEMNIWTAVPKPMQVFYDSLIPLIQSDFAITVKEKDGATPVVNALVCMMGNIDTLLYRTGYTDNNGGVTFSVAPAVNLDTVWITVTAKNHIPYEGHTLTGEYGVEEGARLMAGDGELGLKVFPNPFSERVTIMLNAESNEMLPRLRIYDAVGNVVKSLATGRMPATQYGGSVLSLVWDGTDDAGRRLPDGIYFIRLENQDTKVIDKVIMLR